MLLQGYSHVLHLTAHACHNNDAPSPRSVDLMPSYHRNYEPWGQDCRAARERERILLFSTLIMAEGDRLDQETGCSSRQHDLDLHVNNCSRRVPICKHVTARRELLPYPAPAFPERSALQQPGTYAMSAAEIRCLMGVYAASPQATPCTKQQQVRYARCTSSAA